MVEAVSKLTASPDVPSGDVRAQLDRILKSADFEATARERKFLGYVVEEELDGRGARIKAYSIAVEVFGRDASFDPQNDPIVRIEAGHLRRSLERYYLTGGHADPVLIEIPKGGYVPTFARRYPKEPEVAEPDVPAPMPQASPGSWRRLLVPAAIAVTFAIALLALALQFSKVGFGPTAPETPRLLVENFQDLTGSKASGPVATGLTQEVISQLSKFREIAVVEAIDVSGDGTVTRPRYALSGSVASSPQTFRLRVRLVNQADGSVLWANSYDGDASVSSLVQAQADIAQNVATVLAQTYGVIFQADARLRFNNPPEDWEAYSCTLSYYAYRTGMDQTVLPAVQSCLEKAVQRFPNYATAWGLLAQTYIDKLRFRFPFDMANADAQLDRALSAARRAVELDALNVRGMQAEMFALFFKKEYEAARVVGERALAINPNDTDLMGEYGYRLAASGNWTEGCGWVAKARERNPGPLAYYETALALCALRTGDNAAAVMWIKKTTAPRNPLYHLIAAAIYGGAGLDADADRERAWLEEHQPDLARDPEREIRLRLARSEDVDFFMGCLRKAGFPSSQESSQAQSGL